MNKSHYTHGDETMKREYKTFSNKLTKLKANAKTICFAEELDKNKSNPQKTPKKQSKASCIPDNVNMNGNKITDQCLILEELNTFSPKLGKI